MASTLRRALVCLCNWNESRPRFEERGAVYTVPSVTAIHVRHHVQRIIERICSGWVDRLLRLHSRFHHGMVLRKLLQIRIVFGASCGLVLHKDRHRGKV